jgi:hypothetical protein
MNPTKPNNAVHDHTNDSGDHVALDRAVLAGKLLLSGAKTFENVTRNGRG